MAGISAAPPGSDLAPGLSGRFASLYLKRRSLIVVFWIGTDLLGALGLGTSVVRLIFRHVPWRNSLRCPGITASRAEIAGSGLVLGIALNSYLQFLWSLAGGKLDRGCSLTLAIGGMAIGLLTWLNSRRQTQTMSAEPCAEHQGQFANDSSLASFCRAAIGVIFLSAVVQTLLTPQRFWDERAYYGLKAIVLFEDQTIFSPDLSEADFVQGHPRYPLMISLAEQHLYSLLGRVDDRWSKIIFPVLFLGLVLTFGGVLSRNREPGFAWLGALMLATLPVLMPDDYGFLSGQADAPVACLNGLAIPVRVGLSGGNG